MIKCSVCDTANDHLATICKSCGAYLQTRTDNLDLFQTAWNVLENPNKAFHTIAVATHKNYSYIIPGFAGYAFIFFFFWLIKAGEYTNSLLNFLAAGFITGPPFGILLVIIFSIINSILLRIAGRSVSFRNSLSVISYSLIPVVISVVIVLPLEIMTFGLFFFTSNPSPYALKPFSYVALLVLDGIFTLWTLILISIGFRTLTGRRWIEAAVYELIAIGLLSGLIYWLYKMFFPVPG